MTTEPANNTSRTKYPDILGCYKSTPFCPVVCYAAGALVLGCRARDRPRWPLRGAAGLARATPGPGRGCCVVIMSVRRTGGPWGASGFGAMMAHHRRNVHHNEGYSMARLGLRWPRCWSPPVSWLRMGQVLE